MAWQVIAEGATIEEFQASTTTAIEDLPKGTKLKYRVETPWWAPVGKLADIAGAEFLAPYFTPEGIIIDDVYGNWHWMEVKATVDPPLAPLVAVTVIIVALSALGIAYFLSRIVLEADLPALVALAVTTIALVGGIAAACVIALALLRRKRAPV